MPTTTATTTPARTRIPSSIPLTKHLRSWFLTIFLTISLTTYFAITYVFPHSPFTSAQTLGLALLLSFRLCFMIKKTLDRNPEFWLDLKRNEIVQHACAGANIILHMVFDFQTMYYLEKFRETGVQVEVIGLFTGVAMTLVAFLTLFYYKGIFDGFGVIAAGLNVNSRYLIRLKYFKIANACGLVSTLFLVWLLVKILGLNEQTEQIQEEEAAAVAVADSKKKE